MGKEAMDRIVDIVFDQNLRAPRKCHVCHGRADGIHAWCDNRSGETRHYCGEACWEMDSPPVTPVWVQKVADVRRAAGDIIGFWDPAVLRCLQQGETPLYQKPDPYTGHDLAADKLVAAQTYDHPANVRARKVATLRADLDRPMPHPAEGRSERAMPRSNGR